MANTKPTRTDRLLALLLSRKGGRVSLPEVQSAAGAQHGARLRELKDRGYMIENSMERVNGDVHSWYTLRAGPGETVPMFPIPERSPLSDDISRFEAARMRRCR